jgi:Fe-Mn family superoxide dismutase
MCCRFNGGGHLNHSIFWTNLAPPKQGGGDAPTGALLAEINKTFGSLQKFQVSPRSICIASFFVSFLVS